MLVVFNYFLADMFINILSFVKALPLDFLIGNHTVRSETPIFFSKSTVSMFKRSIFIKQSCDKVELFKFLIKELLGLLKTFQRQNIAFNMWNIVKKKCLIVAQKVKKCSISAQKQGKCSSVLEMKKCRRSAHHNREIPSSWHKFPKYLLEKIPKYRAGTSSQDSIHYEC